MPKAIFKVPFLDPNGNPASEVKRDWNKLKPNDRGELIAEAITDENGYAVMEPVMLHNVIIDTLLGEYEGDYKLPGKERLARHELAMKVKNEPEGGQEYSDAELRMIDELAAKSKRTTVLGRIAEAIK